MTSLLAYRLATAQILAMALTATAVPATAEQAGNLDKLLAEIEASVVFNQYMMFGVRNGEYYITDFDVETFDPDKEREKMRRKYPPAKKKGDCDFDEWSEGDGLYEIQATYETSPNGYDMLAKLDATKQVLDVIGFTQAYRNIDNKQCNRQAFRIFFINGKVLNLNYTKASFL